MTFNVPRYVFVCSYSRAGFIEFLGSVTSVFITFGSFLAIISSCVSYPFSLFVEPPWYASWYAWCYLTGLWGFLSFYSLFFSPFFRLNCFYWSFFTFLNSSASLNLVNPSSEFFISVIVLFNFKISFGSFS